MAKPITPEEMTAYVEATWNKCKEEAWQEQEPVAWADKVGAVIPHSHKLFQPDLLKDYTRPLYTTPPQKAWVGLSDEDIDLYALDIGVTANKAPAWLVTYARDIETKLREKNGG